MTGKIPLTVFESSGVFQDLLYLPYGEV